MCNIYKNKLDPLGHIFTVSRFVSFSLATLHGMWDLSSLTRDQTHASCTGSAES